MKMKITDRACQRKSASEAVTIWDTALPGFALRINPGGRRAFFVMTRVNGGQRRFAVGTYPALSLADARKAAGNILNDAASGVDPKERARQELQEAERRRRDTFEAVAREFIADHVAHLRASRDVINKIEGDLLPAWSDRPITSITRREIKELLRDKARTSPVAANRLLATIRKLFNWALDEEIVEANPAARIKPPSKEVERERILAEDEIRSIWGVAQEMGHPWGPMIHMLFVTAQRLGEVAAMRWDEIDMEKATWTLSGERTKSGAGHIVPLSPLALKVLDAIPETGKVLDDTPQIDKELDDTPETVAHVFTSGRVGDKAPSGFGKAKARVDRLSGVTEWRFHDIRRVAATNMRELGVDRLTVSKILNHKEAGVTKVYDRYAADPEKRRALERWANRLEHIVGTDGDAGKVIKLR